MDMSYGMPLCCPGSRPISAVQEPTKLVSSLLFEPPGCTLSGLPEPTVQSTVQNLLDGHNFSSCWPRRQDSISIQKYVHVCRLRYENFEMVQAGEVWEAVF